MCIERHTPKVQAPAGRNVYCFQPLVGAVSQPHSAPGPVGAVSQPHWILHKNLEDSKKPLESRRDGISVEKRNLTDLSPVGAVSVGPVGAVSQPHRVLAINFVHARNPL